MIQFNNLPKEKPSQNNVEPGRYTATVFKSEMRTSNNTGTEYLNVSFKLDKGGFVNENYFDSEKQFLQFKLGQLLKACGVTLEGAGTLKDVAKVIQGKKVIVDVVVNDKGYGALDYTGNNDGIYNINDVAAETGQATNTDVAIDADLSQAIDDEDF